MKTKKSWNEGQHVDKSTPRPFRFTIFAGVRLHFVEITRLIKRLKLHRVRSARVHDI